MSNYKINRRKFITSTGAIFTLPMLESLFPFSKAFAQAANDPKRLVVFYFPNGSCQRATNPIWSTPQVGPLSASNTSKALSPFASNYSEMIMVNRHDFGPNLHGDDHVNGAMSFIACARNSDGMRTVTSFDHQLADRLGKKAWILSGGATSSDFTEDSYISYRNGVGDKGISNPGDVLRNLLGSVASGGTTTPTNGNNARQKSILDASLADFTALRGKLGVSDRLKLDEFQTSVRDLETKVLATATPPPMTGGACVKPSLNASLDTSNTTDTSLYLPKFYAMNDMIKTAFACDITRVVTIMLDTETSNRKFAAPPSSLIYNGADITGKESHIGLSHTVPSAVGYNNVVTRDRVMLQIVIDLVEKLKLTTDASGSRILDNTIIHSGFGVEDGAHGDQASSADNLWVGRKPLLIMGGRNMMSPGKAVSFVGSQQRDIFNTYSVLMNAGVPSFQGSTKTVPL